MRMLTKLLRFTRHGIRRALLSSISKRFVGEPKCQLSGIRRVGTLSGDYKEAIAPARTLLSF